MHGASKPGLRAVAGWQYAHAGDVIGHRADGRPIYLIGGGAPDDGDGDDGGDDGGDGGDDDLIGGGGGDGDDGGDDGDNGDDGDGDDDDEKLTPALKALISKEANRIADKRINQALAKRGNRRAGRRDNADDDGDGDDDKGGNGGKPKGKQETGPTSADLREARLVYRDFVRDEIEFIDNDERAFAADLAQGMLRDRLADHEDVEEAGEAVATEVAKRVRTLRANYQKATIAGLKRRGVLPKDWKSTDKGGQQKRGPASRGTQAALDEGARRAQQVRPGRFAQETADAGSQS
jgi:hypothetical protein